MMKSEQDKAFLHMTKWSAIALGAFIVTLLTVFPLGWLFDSSISSSQANAEMKQYFSTVLSNPIGWLVLYGKWLVAPKVGAVSFIPFLPPIVLFMTLVAGVAKNRYSFKPSTHGSARFAEEADIQEMGLLKGSLMVLGKWRNRYLMLPETLSVLSIAPPGTGKTTSIVVPSILTAGKCSLIINDVKPELAKITSGYRATCSRVFIMDWAAEDQPEKNIFYPRWNPLSPSSVPEKGARRDLYIDRLATVLASAGVEGKSDGNMEYFVTKAKAVLAGFMHYIIEKIDRGDYSAIPQEWQGKEASIPMFQDWFALVQRDAGLMKNVDDPLKATLNWVITDVKQQGYSSRILLELTELSASNDRERASVISVMNKSLNIFKNSAVRARTSGSDIHFEDFRGVWNAQKQTFEPVTLYLCVNQEDAKTLAPITALFIEALSAWLIANPPGTSANGKMLGDCPAAFILDEFPQMPKLQALIDGPAVGRGQKVSYLMIGQDLGQIEEKYGLAGVETLMSTTAAKVILPLNNEKTAQRFSQMIGKTTIVTKSTSRQSGDFLSGNTTRQEQGVELIKPEELMSLSQGEHIVLFQKFLSRPIRVSTPAYYKEKDLKRLVNREFGGEYDPAPAMPEKLVAERMAKKGDVKEKIVASILIPLLLL